MSTQELPVIDPTTIPDPPVKALPHFIQTYDDLNKLPYKQLEIIKYDEQHRVDTNEKSRQELIQQIMALQQAHDLTDLRGKD